MVVALDRSGANCFRLVLSWRDLALVNLILSDFTRILIVTGDRALLKAMYWDLNGDNPFADY